MRNFSYKEVYVEDGRRVLEINILPEKHCNFDCIFCPIGRSQNKIDKPKAFDNIEEDFKELEDRIEETKADLVFINSKGEALVNDKVSLIIDMIKAKGVAVRLLSNGYLLAKEEYIQIANKCEEVIGEIKVITEEHFQKVQRPIEGYTLKEYILNMAMFSKQYKGKFIFEVTIIKGYNDSKESIEEIKKIIKEIAPDEVLVVRMEDEKFKKKLGISDERFEEISKALRNS
nr:radical SAM protein [uncultured Cellulosilyticum sp.]